MTEKLPYGTKQEGNTYALSKEALPDKEEYLVFQHSPKVKGK